MRRWLLRGLWLPILMLLPPLLLLSAGFYGYQRLTAEALLAELQFKPLAPQEYRVAVTWAEGCRTDEYQLYGDQWRVDALFIKWKYWATLLGIDPLFRLERLEGRYRSAAEQNSAPLLAHDLGEQAALDLLAALASWQANPLFDSRYGSSAYADIDPTLRYRLYRGQTGLLIRTEPLEQLSVNQGGLTITIAHPCAERESGWQQLAAAFNRWWLGPG